MEITILGTSSAVPLLKRNLSATVLGLDHEYILFDCGEGTQFHLRKARLHPTKIHTIAVTHLHGDHAFGLPGLISSINYSNKSDSLTIIGPKGIKEILETGRKYQQFFTEFDLVFIELDFMDKPSIILETEKWSLSAVSLDHRIPSFGYRFDEKPRPGHLNIDRALAMGLNPGPQLKQLKSGKAVVLDSGVIVSPGDVVGPEQPGYSFCYVTDTRFCNRSVELAKSADLLMHEATYLDELRDKAMETGHSSALDAAKVAELAGVHELVLFHFSARYPNPEPLLLEAKRVFPNTRLGEDFMKIIPGHTH